MRLTYFLLIGVAATSAGLAQAPVPTNGIRVAQAADLQRLPPYAVYRHFLNWVNQLDKAAVASGAADPYKFAEPFRRAHLASNHLDLVRKEARALTDDLEREDARARAIIDRYRETGAVALSQGKALPAVPAEIRQLQREQTGILIQHYVALRSALGSEGAAKLDAFLAYEFAPHIKLRRVSGPGQPSLR